MSPSTTEIRVLSIRQPYADQILSGEKWCENRTWSTRYRGRLFIHASRWEPSEPRESPGKSITGAIIGCVDLDDVLDLEAMSYPEIKAYAKKHGLSLSENSTRHICGPIGFIMKKPQTLAAPIPIGGKLNIWRTTVPEHALAMTGSTRPAQSSPATKQKPRKRSSAPKRVATSDSSSPKPIRIGARVIYGQRPYFVGAIDEELVGLCEKRGGPIVTWEDSTELTNS